MKISKDPRPAMWNAGRSPHSILIWAVGLTGVGLAALVSTFMQGALDSPMFPWFPAGVAAGFVLRFGPRLAGLGGVALAAAFLLSTPAGSPDLGWILLLASSHAIGLVLLPFALGASGRRVCVGRIRPADAARLLVFGIPTVVLPTGLILWWWPPGSALESAARIDLPASLTLGLLATLPITVTLLPDATGRRTYRCHADRLVKVIPGLALLLATTAVSWWLPTSPGGDLVHLLFAVAVLASLTWVAAHSGWFASSTALLMVCFSDPTPTFGDVLMLCPVLVFGIVIAATMEQRFRHAAKIKDRHLEIDALLQATGAAVIRLDRDGRILFGNSQAQDLLAQLDSDLAADDHFSVAFDGRSRRLVRAAINVVMMGKRRECEVSVKRDDGPRSLHLAVFTPLHDATFEICGCSVVLLDLATSRRRALLRQRRQEREFKSLAHALVHDVNNLA
ncbi:MAG: PAS domain-containing protein, partial [Planctomycetota bacterium]|nr:PAS domain-containing protein [Planctomycetota bacterium]